MNRLPVFLITFFLSIFICACGSGPKIELDPESEAFYETARLVMTGEEKDIFNHLPDAASRHEFIEEFWRKRDPDPYTEENEFKKEFFGRVEHANKRFKEGIPGWKTDRGRIYIFMGPPDKFEEFFNHGDPDIRGLIIWWIYYTYELGIEFVDEKGNGSYKIRRYDGDFFSALDNLKMGHVPVQKGEKRKFVNFKLDYDRAAAEIRISLPVDVFNFKEEAGLLRADLEFEFFVYARDKAKVGEFKEKKTIAETEDRLLQMKEVVVSIPHRLSPGTYYLDVIIIGQAGEIGKTRKIFEVKV
ncbi:MAG: GWxTD domain-containing protein [Clostridiales bacterium]|nr:GWxTD domain-containing protein [Clostridiales bacterium]